MNHLKTLTDVTMCTDNANQITDISTVQFITRRLRSGGASAVKEPGHFEVR